MSGDGALVTVHVAVVGSVCVHMCSRFDLKKDAGGTSVCAEDFCMSVGPDWPSDSDQMSFGARLLTL